MKSRKSSVKKLSVNTALTTGVNTDNEDCANRFIDASRASGPLTVDELVDIVRVLGNWSNDTDAFTLECMSTLGRHYLCIRIVEALSRQFDVNDFGRTVYELLDSDMSHLHLSGVMSFLSRMV